MCLKRQDGGILKVIILATIEVDGIVKMVVPT
jgi:hypothetical protein